jgi:hypothetical protein
MTTTLEDLIENLTEQLEELQGKVEDLETQLSSVEEDVGCLVNDDTTDNLDNRTDEQDAVGRGQLWILLGHLYMQGPMSSMLPCKCSCGGTFTFSSYCAAFVCDKCDNHQGMARCFCGWSSSGRSGRLELEEMGEVIDPEDY